MYVRVIMFFVVTCVNIFTKKKLLVENIVIRKKIDVVKPAIIYDLFLSNVIFYNFSRFQTK